MNPIDPLASHLQSFGHLAARFFEIVAGVVFALISIAAFFRARNEARALRGRQ